ncbi:MAG TPA: sigma-70 factor domain-containing protein [Candidatus Methylomirabilis sp.]|nr:sigma-70 factor domain-containing protein [Candidatus Methylomirabilis sp.]
MYTGYVGTTRLDDDPVQVYLREVCATPALTRDEEIELSQHVLAHDQQAESAGTRLIEANLAMVVSIAERYRDGGMPLLELIQKGNDGLLLALKTFADNPNESFSAHAAACINDAIAKAIAESRLARG